MFDRLKMFLCVEYKFELFTRGRKDININLQKNVEDVSKHSRQFTHFRSVDYRTFLNAIK